MADIFAKSLSSFQLVSGGHFPGEEPESLNSKIIDNLTKEWSNDMKNRVFINY